MWFLRRPVVQLARQMSTLQRHSAKKALLSQPVQASGRRFKGHGPDITGMEALLYVVIGGGGFAVWGLYKTVEMRDKIEAFETGQLVPFKSLTDEELLTFRKRFKKLHTEGEEDEEEEEDQEEAAQVEADEQAEHEDESYGTPRRIAKSSKDTVIFVGPDK